MLLMILALVSCTTPIQARLTSGELVDRAKAFLQTSGLDVPQNAKTRVDIRWDPQGHESAEVAISSNGWDVQYVGIDVLGGEITSYSAGGKSGLARKSDRTGVRKFSSDDDARVACEAWLKKFVSGKDMRCTKLTQGQDSRDRWGMISSLGMVNATFTEFAHGYPYVVGVINECRIGLDIQSGDLWQMRQYFRAVPESWTVGIDGATAREAAVSFFKKQFGIDPPGFSKVVLGYAVPNGQFGSPNRVSKPPHLARLAYVCWFQDVERKKANFWIDAGNGAVIGGSSLGY